MDCNANDLKGGSEEEVRDSGAASNISQVSSVEGLEFGTGIPRELLVGPGPEFPESDQALLKDVAARFVLELFNESAEAMEFGQVSPQDVLENKVLGESKSPRSLVGTHVEEVQADGTFEKSRSTDEEGKLAQGLLPENEGGRILNEMPACAEGNGTSMEIPNVELSPIESTATKSNAVGFSATELLAPLENQTSIGGGMEAMTKSIPKAATSARFRQPFFGTSFYRGGRGLSRILKDNKTMEALDFKDLDRVFQPQHPWTEMFLRFRIGNFTRMRNQMRMSPSWAKPRPLSLSPSGPSSKTEPPCAGAGVILEHEEVHEPPVETESISSDVSIGERPMSKAQALLNPETLARVRLMLRKPIPDTWVRFARGRYLIQMPQQRLEWEDAYVKHILTSNRTGDKGMAEPQAAVSEGRGIPPAMKPPNGIESESHASSQYDLRSGNQKTMYESASDCSVDKTQKNDSKETPTRSEALALESDNEKMAMLPALKQMEGPPKEEKKTEGNFFDKIRQRLHSRSSLMISTASSEDFKGKIEGTSDISVVKKSELEEGPTTKAPRKLEWFETPVPSDLNLDDPIHRPLLPVYKPRTRLQRFLDFMLCRRREPKAVDLWDHLEKLQRNQRELDKFLQKKAKKEAQRKAKREAKASKKIAKIES